MDLGLVIIIVVAGSFDDVRGIVSRTRHAAWWEIDAAQDWRWME